MEQEPHCRTSESQEQLLTKHRPQISITEFSEGFTPKATFSFNHNGMVNIEGEDSEMFI